MICDFHYVGNSPFVESLCFFLWFWILQDIAKFHKRSLSISCCPHTKYIVFFLVESLWFVAVENVHIVGNPFLRCCVFFLIWCWIPQNFTWHHFIFTQFKILVEFKKLLKNARIYKNNCSVGNALHNVAKCCGMLYNRYIVWQWITNWIVISC